MDDQRLDIIESMDEEGNPLLLSVDRYFYYNGEEYALLHQTTADGQPAGEAARYVMRVNVSTDQDGDEVEEFVPVEAELMEVLLQMATTKYRAEAITLGERPDDEA